MHTASRNAPIHALRWHIRGNVVSQHAQRIIVQFMAACCGKSTKDRDVDDEDLGRESKMKELLANALVLDRAHAVLDRMSQEKETGGKEKATATKS